MIISVKELKEFLSKASAIRPKGIMPILENIKIEVGEDKIIRLVKTALDSFIKIKTTAVAEDGDVSLLVEEKMLSGLVSNSHETHISFTVKKEVIEITDGTTTAKCKNEKVELYPVLQSNEGEKKYEMSSDILEGLSVAKNHVLHTNERADWECFVHVKNLKKVTVIGATNREISYLKRAEEPFPDVVLDPETLSAISSFREAQYSFTEKYNFFETDSIAYGFIKPMMAVADAVKLWDRFGEKSGVEVHRKEVIDFSSMVISISRAGYPPEVSLSKKDDELWMTFDDPMDDNKHLTRKIKVIQKEGEFPEALFQPKNVITTMKDLGVDNITITDKQQYLLLTSEEDNTFKAIIMKLAKL